jgi:hypothetical protein
MFHLMRYFYAVKLISLHHYYLLKISEFDPGCSFCLVLKVLALYIYYIWDIRDEFLRQIPSLDLNLLHSIFEWFEPLQSLPEINM